MIKSVDKINKLLMKTDGKIYNKFFIYIPISIDKDSVLPFKPEEEVIVRIEVDRLVIKKKFDKKSRSYSNI